MREVIRGPQRSSWVISGNQRQFHTEALDASRRGTKLWTAAECVERPCQMEAHERSPTCSSACTDNVDANALRVEEEAAAAVRAVLGAEVDAAAAGRPSRDGSGAT